MNKRIKDTTIGSRSVVDRVVDGIITDIIEGKIEPGAQLPTEPVLCQEYDAGRNSVREAIKKLEAYGIVYIKRADGTYVSETYNQKMLDPMLYNIILGKNSWDDFVELRRVIEIGTLHVVVERPSDSIDTEKLHKAIDEMERELYKDHPLADKVLELDANFHRQIAMITNNPQLVSITEYITRLTLPSRRLTVKEVIGRGEKENFIKLHRQMVDLIEEREATQIEQIISNHYVYWK
ncbi:GntR family transcriptional regulator [Sporanaerobium hydrogeniformans]|uniref:GntR family transcriptional regulator n=1 Tax=Sporanaerobium hydrogeniformans TaxID=3072179 RepID=A0AC61D745_9FIRM|nr:FCD domain-containing protein [Sporanaerobium hydrogeniformans]PHV69421.1 GntR family transcriptional regulator [Sporanaerobium hydrogeniformans]